MIDILKATRHNKLLEMTSICDQCMTHGYFYEPDNRDLELIDYLDSEILKLSNGGMGSD
jgi:hypothetical protein